MKLVTTCPHLPPLSDDDVLAFFSQKHDGRTFLIMEVCRACACVLARQMRDAKMIDPLGLLKESI